MEADSDTCCFISKYNIRRKIQSEHMNKQSNALSVHEYHEGEAEKQREKIENRSIQRLHPGPQPTETSEETSHRFTAEALSGTSVKLTLFVL